MNNYTEEITKIEAIEIVSSDPAAIELPEKIKIFLDGKYSYRGVQWENIDLDELKAKGELVVKGKLSEINYPEPLVEKRADPYIYKHSDGYYYFTGSYPDYDRIVLRRAKNISDLKNAEEYVLWEKYDQGEMSKHIWAPEIHYINGKWYIYFAAGKKDDVWAIRPYVLECQDENPLTGEWIEKGEINIEFESFSLDATTFKHQGKRYLIWAQKVADNTISNLYIAEMENPWTIKSQHLLSEPEYDWEVIGFDVNEGPAVIKRNGEIFVTFSASETGAPYCMGLLSADQNSNLLDRSSWTKSKKPVLKTSEVTSLYGPGHNSFTKSEDGVTDLLVYHARPYKEIKGNPLYDPNRHGRIQEIFWQENGKPYFAYPGLKINDRIEVEAKIKLKK
ncbi:family 43 glycosylhydrolase [Halanaerobium sp. ST460_2HS_T2]|uniref:glycoside hydrolase family 43 protein n=1 Tax=Halanaerobium sp. ST460_2HS_T2 TaxID=2183914 RepID=UPI000DF4506D|nr:glycoside hydrolase family 43 protein [Halanaerobium sp. ST460_2HS_T2]RCW58744.1 GH43 family beta-xylosidase [Halanaerobium sp. ST460_2HS_T2]